MSGVYGDLRWRENLRMYGEVLEMICSEVRPFFPRQASRLPLPICVKTTVAVTNWLLTTNHQTIAALFGLGRSTVCEIAQQLAPCHIYV